MLMGIQEVSLWGSIIAIIIIIGIILLSYRIMKWGKKVGLKTHEVLLPQVFFPNILMYLTQRKIRTVATEWSKRDRDPNQYTKTEEPDVINENPLDIAKRRLAAGEISLEEYEGIKNALK